MTLVANLKVLGGGLSEGALQGHPCEHMLVYAHRLTPTEATVGLWELLDAHDHQRCLRGSGLVRLAADRWTGTCNEGKATWYLSADEMLSRLEFRERP